MNGTRLTFMRTGYWLTALAAVLLLAAPASAQVTVTAPGVVEGESATITVTGKASIPIGTAATTVTLTVTATSDILGDDTENDVSQNLGTVATLSFPANTADGAEVVTATRSATLIVQTHQDADAEDETITLGYNLAGHTGLNNEDGLGPLTEGATNPMSFKIDDDETQTYVLAVSPASQKPKEGTGVTVSLSAMPAHEDDDARLTVNIDKPAPTYTMAITQNSEDVTGNAVTIGANTTASATITVTQANPDGNRASDTATLTAYSGRAGASKLEASLPITIADLHALPSVTAMVVGEDGKALDPQPDYVAEGKSVMFKVMVLDPEGNPDTAGEALKVELSPSGSADARDYRLSISTVDIGEGKGESSAVTLMAELDEDVGMETLILNATVSGTMTNGAETSTSDGALSIDIMDNTEKQITPKSSEADYDRIKAATADLNPDETVEIMTSDLFTVEEGFSASYSVSVEGDSVSAFASGEVVTINAEIAGESKITVTGTASMSADSLIPSQTVSNVASLTFPVTVVDTTLVVTLSADPMEINEGDMSTITATATREITVGDGAVKIDLTVVGDGTLDADSITIALGAMSDSAVLTTTEDDEDFEDETVTVVATGSGIDGTMQVAIAVTDNDKAPAVPNQISAKPQDVAYPAITAAIALGAGEDEMLTPGESFELMASDLFTVVDGYDATYRVSVDSAAVSGLADGDSISVTAASAGDAKVTITGTATMAASSFDASQDATNVASITFPVTVEAEPEPEPEPVPALPLIAQWLLGLGLMGGGARQLFRRRRQG